MLFSNCVRTNTKRANTGFAPTVPSASRANTRFAPTVPFQDTPLPPASRANTRFARTAVLFMSALAFVVGAAASDDLLPSSASAAPPDFVYQLQDGPRSREFNIVARVKSTSDDPAACVLLCTENKDNCYRVDITKSGTKIVRVEMGRETVIGNGTKIGLDKSASLLIKRRRLTITVAIDGRKVTEAYDESFTRGKVGVGARKNSVAFDEFKVYECGESYFADDFMTTKAVAWEPATGTWSVLESSNPTLSANPFKYSGKAAPPAAALSLARKPGSANWDDYSVEVSAKDDAGAMVGLAFYCVDAKNYHLFRWNGKTSDKPVKEIVRVRDGAETVLASVPGGYLPGEWYSLRVDVQGITAKAFVDDNLIAEAKDPELIGGTVGLYSQAPRGTYFDDVLLRGIGAGAFEDDFGLLMPGKWLQLGGKWSASAGTEADTGKVTGTAPASAKLVGGDGRWRNYVVACEIHAPKSGAAGLAFYYQDELNHFLYRAEASGRRELIRVYDGVKKVLASAELPFAKDAESTAISNEDGLIRLSVNGAEVLDAFDAGLSEGRVGLYVEKGTASFGRISVQTPPPPEPILSLPEAFAAEKSQEIYAADQRDWIPDDLLDLNGRKWWWYRANLFGSSSVSLDLSDAKANNTSFELALSAEDSTTSGGGDPASGYRLTVWKAGAWQVAISRKGEQVKRAASVFKDDLWKIDFQRNGRYLFGRLNNKLEIWLRDDQPLRGSRAGYALVPPPAPKLKAEVYCPNLITYTFAKSPVEWRSAAGEWEVSNRWSCDDRWSWFSGEARNGPAIIWNKHSFSGDFSMEFCGAIKMDNKRGSEYSYARDMNLAIAADGLDVTSGYSFIFGGWNNALSCIARKDTIAMQPRKVDDAKFKQSANMHRQWWYFKVERRAGKMRWFLDNKLVTDAYIDPDPIDGARVALWAYDVGITVARVRIAAENIAPMESPDFPAKVSKKTIYESIPAVTKTVNEYIPSKKP